MAAEGEARDVILIVDDDESIREAIESALAFENHPTATAGDGKQALEWLRRNRTPALILLDLMMPVMDGWQLLEELRRDERLSRVPVVVITAFGRDLGTAAEFPVLRKPINLEDLLQAVGSHCPPGA
jgi:CheY-like chemotaxis protein